MINKPPLERTKVDRRAAKIAALDEIVARCNKLESWTSFVEELKVPGDLFPAIVSNRPEMVKLAQPRALSADESAVLYKLIGGLMETNAALREHAEQVSILVKNWAESFIALDSLGRQIEAFAAYRAIVDDLPSEGDDAV